MAGGRATTGPCTGRLAIAGAGVTTAGAGRGCGITIRRGTGVGPGCAGVAPAVGVAETGTAGEEGVAGRPGCATTVTGRGAADGVATGGRTTGGRTAAAGGAGAPGRTWGALADWGAAPCGAFAAGRGDAGATVTGGRGAGVARAAASACLRSRIALSASPGFETCDRLKPCFVSAEAAERDPMLAGRTPRFTKARTFSASSSSMELECVFFSVTPTAVRASRIVLLLTSSSLARSLIRTLVIRSFSEKLPFAPSWS